MRREGLQGQERRLKGGHKSGGRGKTLDPITSFKGLAGGKRKEEKSRKGRGEHFKKR